MKRPEREANYTPLSNADSQTEGTRWLAPRIVIAVQDCMRTAVQLVACL
jgi:hypothetical protein